MNFKLPGEVSKWKRCFIAVVLCCLLVTILTSFRYKTYGSANFESFVHEKSKPEIRSTESNDFDIRQDRKLGSTSELDPGTAVSGQIPDHYSKTDFDINGTDVMVFLHMQKTGGSVFGRHLVSNIELDKDCENIVNRKRRKCLRPNSDIETWIFSRYSTGTANLFGFQSRIVDGNGYSLTGWACGLHSDWTEMKECVPDKIDKMEKVKKNRRFFYITVLRHPISRYISELKHVQRGATWKRSKFSCNHVAHNIPKCFDGENWQDVTLTEFMSCQSNMANNRQTRMLADLRLINCYERWLNFSLSRSQIEAMEQTMLKSAIKNLKELSFFGILEEQQKLQYVFEHTFSLKFKEDFYQYNVTRSSSFTPTEDEENKIKKLNHLDLQLYQFAVKLFEQRYQNLKHSEDT